MNCEKCKKPYKDCLCRSLGYFYCSLCNSSTVKKAWNQRFCNDCMVSFNRSKHKNKKVDDEK